MFVRRLVIGVRSSCEASATSWRWARTDSSSASREPCEPLDHRVEAGRELADLVVGVVLDPAGQVLGVGDVLRGLGDLGQRREHAPGREPPEAGGERDPAGEQQEQDQSQVREDVVDGVERPRELQGRRLATRTDYRR